MWEEVTCDRVTGAAVPTGRIVADNFVLVRLRDPAKLDRLQDLMASHDDVRVHAVSWVDDDNPAWTE